MRKETNRARGLNRFAPPYSVGDGCQRCGGRRAAVRRDTEKEHCRRRRRRRRRRRMAAAWRGLLGPRHLLFAHSLFAECRGNVWASFSGKQRSSTRAIGPLSTNIQCHHSEQRFHRSICDCLSLSGNNFTSSLFVALKIRPR